MKKSDKYKTPKGRKAYWSVDSTTIEEFDSLEQAWQSLDVLIEDGTEYYETTIGGKTVQIPVKDISVTLN